MPITMLLKLWNGVPSTASLGNAAPLADPPKVLDLLNGSDFSIKDESGSPAWVPAIATLKNNGIRMDSALQDGSDLIGAAVGNVIETITLYAPSSTTVQARMASIKNLSSFARSARQFHTTSWQRNPVYIEWQAAGAPASQYALIYNMDVAISRYNPADANDIPEVTLTIEREPAWRAIAPGDNPKKWILLARGLRQSSSTSPLSDEFSYADMALNYSAGGFYSTDAALNDPLNIIPNAVTNGITGYTRTTTSLTSSTPIAMETKWTRNYVNWLPNNVANAQLTVLANPGAATYDMTGTAGTVYRATVWVNTLSPTTVELRLVNQAGTVFGTQVTLTRSAPLNSGVWTKMTVVGTAPVGTTNIYVALQRTGTSPTTEIQVAGLMITTGTQEPVGYNTGIDAIKNAFISTPVYNFDEARTERVNYVDIPAYNIPGDAPALVNFHINTASVGMTSLSLARTTQKDYYPDSNTLTQGPFDETFRLRNSITAGDMTLGTSVATLTLSKVVSVVGQFSNGSTTTRTLVRMSFTAGATVSQVAVSMIGELSQAQMRGKYRAYVRGTFTGTTQEVSFSLDNINFYPVPSTGYQQLDLGLVDFSLIDRFVNGDAESGEVDLRLWVTKSAGAAIATFEMNDLLFVPYDEASLIALSNIVSGNYDVYVDNTGIFNVSPQALKTLGFGTSAFVTEPVEVRGQQMMLEPGLRNRIYITWVSSGVNIGSRSVNINIVPRWYGVRDSL